MKFLCPKCKAKYKVADERLANRGHPRMKCRQCAHLIDILAAAAAEDAAGPSVAPPAPDDASGVEAVGRSSARPIPAARATAPVGQPAAAAPAKLVGQPAAAAPAKPAAARVAAASRSVPRPAVAAAMPRAQRNAPGAQAVLRAEPLDAESQQSPAFDSIDEPAPALENSDASESPLQAKKDIAVLEAPFSGEMDGPPASSPSSPATTEEEWYVGIGGTPVGPLSLDELRQKVKSGEATESSLVWREGLEDWKALSAFQEFAVVVVEEPAAEHAPEPEPPAPANVLQSEAPPVSAAPTSVVPASLEELSLPAFRPRARTPLGAWIAVGVALLFGVTIGIVFFGTPGEKQVIKYVEVPAKASAPAAVPAPQPATEEESPAVAAEPTAAGQTARPGSQRGRAPAANPLPAPKAAGGLLAGLEGAPTGAPVARPTGAAEAPAAGRQLDSSAIQRTVSNYVPSVRRGCWQPALDARAPDAPSSARVVAEVTIASSGTVQHVSTSGDPRGYRGLARCIESRVKGWTFPRSGGTTTVNVPFVFAAQ